MLTRMAPLLTRMARMARMARLLTRMARMLTRMLTRWLAGSHIIHTQFQPNMYFTMNLKAFWIINW